VGKFPIGVTFEDRGFQALTSHRRVRKLDLTPIGQFSRFSFRTSFCYSVSESGVVKVDTARAFWLLPRGRSEAGGCEAGLTLARCILGEKLFHSPVAENVML